VLRLAMDGADLVTGFRRDRRSLRKRLIFSRVREQLGLVTSIASTYLLVMSIHYEILIEHTLDIQILLTYKVLCKS
jgi:hypothetical protein